MYYRALPGALVLAHLVCGLLLFARSAALILRVDGVGSMRCTRQCCEALEGAAGVLARGDAGLARPRFEMCCLANRLFL